MSPSALLELRAGFNERMQTLGQRFRLERTGDEWDGILLPVNPIDPTLELGSDWREMATLEMRRDGSPPLKSGDVVIQKRPFWATSEETPSPLWRVVRRDDNPANFAVRFWMIKVTEQDEQPA